MPDLEQIVRSYLDEGDLDAALAALQRRLDQNPDDAEAWLVVLDLPEHEHLRRRKHLLQLLRWLDAPVDRIQDEALAWEVTEWQVGLPRYRDDPQSATCVLTGFLARFPAHQAGLDALTELVCESGDLRHAWGALDDLIAGCADPALEARLWLALGVMQHVSAGFLHRAAESFAAARVCLPGLAADDVRAVYERARHAEWAEEGLAAAGLSPAPAPGAGGASGGS